MNSRPAAGARAAGIALGVLADRVAADPARWHPVAGYGAFAGRLERAIYAPTRTRGIVFAAAALAVPVGAGVLAERAGRRRPALRVSLTALATWTALGGASLGREGVTMASHLDANDLQAARDRLSHLCARDPSGLPANELARATVESLAENTSDAVVAPLLWAAVAGIPGVLGYRAANTLDAMVGYRSPRYRRFGWASARLDDVLNLGPARFTGLLTAACAPVVGGAAATTWRQTLAQARRHPSPNAGWCEASAAAALGVRLGGANRYGGAAEARPILGEGGRVVEVKDIRRAVRLAAAVSAAGAGAAVLLASALGRWSTGTDGTGSKQEGETGSWRVTSR